MEMKRPARVQGHLPVLLPHLLAQSPGIDHHIRHRSASLRRPRNLTPSGSPTLKMAAARIMPLHPIPRLPAAHCSPARSRQPGSNPGPGVAPGQRHDGCPRPVGWPPRHPPIAASELLAPPRRAYCTDPDARRRDQSPADLRTERRLGIADTARRRSPSGWPEKRTGHLARGASRGTCISVASVPAAGLLPGRRLRT
jgi:hypothetical protein